MIQAVIFNLDGVLVCSDECHYHAWTQLAHEQGINLQPELYLKMAGLKRMDSIRILLQGRDRAYTAQEMWALGVRKNDLFNEQIDHLDQESLLPGALETVIALKNKGVKTAVASSSENAAGILRQLRIDHWFDVVVDGTDARRALDTAVKRINRETYRKLEEFGYYRDGKMIKEFRTPTAEVVENLIEKARQEAGKDGAEGGTDK